METILTGDIWEQVPQKAGTAKRQLMTVAYVSSGTHLRLRSNDLLICDASDHAIKTGETSAQLLRTLFNKGVELRSRPDLHAKVGVFGCCALIGSCNLSVSSEERLTELALFTDRKQVVAQATAFIHGLREASEEIDRDFIRRILKIKVHRTPRPGPPRIAPSHGFVGLGGPDSARPHDRVTELFRLGSLALGNVSRFLLRAPLFSDRTSTIGPDSTWLNRRNAAASHGTGSRRR